MFVVLIGLLYFLFAVCAIASFVCFIMVLIQMFQRNETNLGIICIVLTFCTGLGPLVAFIYGWTKATEWNIKKVMMYWSIAIGSQFLVLGLIMLTAIGGAATMGPDQFNFDEDEMGFEMEFDEGEFGMPEGFEMPEGIEIEQE